MPDPCIITMLRSPARLEPHTCNEAANEIERLRKERDDAIQMIKSLEERIGNASILIADWDGYYDADNQTGNAIELAKLIEEAFVILQGKSWR
jgi:hypothetical protein